MERNSGLALDYEIDHAADGFTPVPAISKGEVLEDALPKTLEHLLKSQGLLSDEALNRVLLIQRESGEPLDTIVTRLGLVSEQALTGAMSKSLNLPLAMAADFPDQPVGANDISVAFLREMRILPIAATSDVVTIAVANPFDDFTIKSLAFVFDRAVNRVIARSTDIEAAIDRIYQSNAIEEELDATVDDGDMERLKDLVSDVPVIRAVNRLVVQASDEKASDIHIEPTEDALTIRFRIDGVLREMLPLPAAMRSPLVSRIKIMAGLNIAERRLPQDGRLRVAVRGHEIDLRVATAPSIHGESVVMRILDRSKLALDLATLGFDPELAEQVREAIHRPHGIVLVTGPTGSGKTTTLYAALAILNSQDRKLLTIEDPIEYRLPGVIQTQVNPSIGFTFGTALRSFLRQDPDVMMVGEIRDPETAQIAVQAALTGHMILSTLHTNTAAGAVTRLIDMDVEPFLLSSVLTGVLAQRLVRRLCEDCRVSYRASPELIAQLGLSDGDYDMPFYRAEGCASCRHTGYVGRIALLEFLRINEDIAKLILQRADTRTIAMAGAASAMRTLLADGILKASKGLTTLEEVLRVSRGD